MRYLFIGKNISKQLDLKEKNQLWLAGRCGVTPSHINQIIRGKRNPSVSILIKISEALDITLDDLMEE